MGKEILKKIMIIATIIFFCIQLPLNQAAYSYELKLNQYDLSEIKKEIRLEDDFYNAINQNWIANNKLQNGCVSYGTFEEVCQKVNNDIFGIISDIKINKNRYDKNSNELKVLNLYENYLNIKKRNEIGTSPIEKYMNKVDKIQTVKDLKEILSDIEFSYFQSLLNLGVGPDYKNNDINILYISNCNLGLGNSFYYKVDNGRNKEIKKIYIDYLTKLNMLYGYNEKIARKNAETFYEIENTIAKYIPTYEEEAKDNNRIQKSYNLYTMKELKKELPNLDFDCCFKNLNIKSTNRIIVENPEVLKLVDSFITKENLNNIKTFLRTSILINSDNFLTMEFRMASNPIKKTLYGVNGIDLNEASGIKFISYQLNEIISNLYVDKCVEKNSKEDVENITKEIIKTFKNRLSNIEWMSNSTKKNAINKLDNINVKIGYPEKWNDYNGMEVKSYEEGGTLIDNIIKIYVTQTKKQFSKLNNPVNRSEWSMGACTVNAYYNALNNEIVFPAAILQPPFYDKNASIEKNLGGIGIIIGHELTHAFDNIGAQFDYTGKYKDWWNVSDYKEFTNRSRKVAEYYSNIELEDGNYMNGFVTVGENISDLGGLACVIDIAKNLNEPNFKELFENYAVVWREISTKEFKEYLLNNDLHAPKKIRVNCVLSQFEEFYKTYNIEKQDKMYVSPEKRIGIW